LTVAATPQAISIGLGEHPEFADVRLQTLALLPAGWRGSFTTIDEFLDAEQQLAPELVVVWQQSPEEHSAADVLALLARVPLARVLCVYGLWCESDGRTRAYWPAAMRVPVWQAARRIAAELQALRSQAASLPPWTASREEVWLKDVTQMPQRSLAGVRVVLDISDTAYRQSVAELLTQAEATIVDRDTDCDAVLIDLEPWTSSRCSQVQSLLDAAEETPVIGLAAWITWDLQREWQELGIAAVVPKLDPAALLEALASRERQ